MTHGNAYEEETDSDTWSSSDLGLHDASNHHDFSITLHENIEKLKSSKGGNIKSEVSRCIENREAPCSGSNIAFAKDQMSLL